MTVELDRRIRRFVAELVDAAPLPPLHPAPRTPRVAARPWLRATLTLGFVAATAMALVVAGRDSQEPAPATTVPASPTFLLPANLPPGVQLAVAGRDVIHASFHEILIWSDDFARTARLQWQRASGVCDGPRGSTLPASPAEAIALGRPAIQWCDPDHDLMGTLSAGRGLSHEEVAQLASGITGPVDGRLAIALPPGFRSVVTPRSTEVISARYESPDGSPALHVRVTSAGPLALDRLRADNPGELVVVAGRPGLQAERFVAVLADERTLVVLSSQSLAPADLLAAAGSLAPADPGLAPPVAGRPGLCERLGLCG
jgi:hypothetical protein